MADIQKISTFKNLFESDEPIHTLGIALIMILVGGLIGFVVYSELSLYVLPALIALPAVFLILVRPKIWLALIVFSTLVFFHAGDEGVGALDVALGMFYIGSIAIWFVWSGLIHRKKIIRNWGDWAILTFFTLLLFNFVIAVTNDVVPMNWLREYLLISVMLLYFPVRDTLKNENDINSFLIIFGLVIVATGSYQVLEYYRKVNTNLVYAYELKSSITINQTLYTASSIFGFILAFSQKSKIKELAIIVLTSLYVVFLVTTFSRTFWMVLAAAILLMFFFLPTKKKVLFLTYLGIISVVLLIATFLFMRDKADIALSVAFSRFESTSEGKKDPSLIARFKEWEKVWQHIQENPFGGNGLAKEFTFYFPINSRSRHTTIIHNGYIWLAYRTGIPLALLFMFFIIFYTFKSATLIRFATNPSQRAILIASLSVLLSLYIINLTSSQYFYRDGLFVTSLSVAFISIVENAVSKRKEIEE